MTCTRKLLLPLLFTAAALPALADQIPYASVGSIAPTNLVYATANGINAYYMGSTAGFDNQIQVYDVQTGWESGKVLDNKSSTPGTEITLGTGAGQINAGDELIFYILSPDGLFANVGSYSADGINHAYMTTYSGGKVNGYTVPAGIFVGMEDLNKAHSDLNYNDDDFVFTGVKTTSATPEPAAFALFATGMLGFIALKGLRKQDEI